MGSALFLLALLVGAPAQKPAPSYTGYIRLPVDLYSADGAHLEKGQYVIQVKTDGGKYSLVFLQDDQPKGTVKGDIVPAGEGDGSGFPFMGTQYLRSSEDPVGTEAERHFSKSGLPQYQEENRDWKSTMRVYTTEDQKETRWLFERRDSGTQWLHVQFNLNFQPK